MQLGILTFHSQTNYGGVLQAWALQEALISLGYSDTVVVDRWLDPQNKRLHGDYAFFRPRDWMKLTLRLLLLLGDWSALLRHARTARFLKRRLRLTPYHFTDWREATAAGYPLPDCLVVGSDQVWHAGKWGDPRVYLLKDAPPVHAIAYAASFGFPESEVPTVEQATSLGFWDHTEPLPPGETLGAIYRTGLARFSSISCREEEGVRVARAFGVPEAAHVVDPTLLAPQALWSPFRPRRPSKRPHLFVYLLGESLEAAVPHLERFRKERGWSVDVFVDGNPAGWFGPLPRNGRQLKAWWRAFRLRHRQKLRFRVSAGPEEFLRSIASADGVVSDSFHALMFSILYGRNVRILRPSTEGRRGMFARIEEFATHAQGMLLADDLADALRSVVEAPAPAFDAAWLSERIAQSAAWLKNVIAPAMEGPCNE